MATRNSKIEAEALVKDLVEQYPHRQFRILDNSASRRIGRAVAQNAGYSIIEDTGGPMVTAQVVEFEVLEVRHCGNCGAEVLTRAIGEDSVTHCAQCGKQHHEAHVQQLAADKAREAERVRIAVARDEWEE